MIVGAIGKRLPHGALGGVEQRDQLEGLQAHALDARPIVDAVERGQQGCQSVVGQEDAASVPASIALAQRVEVDAARRVVRPERGAAGLVLDAERQPHVTGHGVAHLPLDDALVVHRAFSFVDEVAFAVGAGYLAAALLAPFDMKRTRLAALPGQRAMRDVVEREVHALEQLPVLYDAGRSVVQREPEHGARAVLLDDIEAAGVARGQVLKAFHPKLLRA